MEQVSDWDMQMYVLHAPTPPNPRRAPCLARAHRRGRTMTLRDAGAGLE